MKDSARKTPEDTNYLRPPLKEIDVTKPLIFMQTDVDYMLSEKDTPVVRIFGVTEYENSVLLLVHNFEPYFYVPLPSNLALDSAKKQELVSTLSVTLLYNTLVL